MTPTVSELDADSAPGLMPEIIVVPDAGPGSVTRPAVDLTLGLADPGSIVVGHDRTGGADAALLTALQLAADLGAPLFVVRAWSMVSAPRPEDWTFGYASATEDIDKAVRNQLRADTLDQITRFPTVATTLVTHHGGPAKTLVQASRDARMLVVGARGVSGLREIVLGSVSDQCVRDAYCPVLVAPGTIR